LRIAPETDSGLFIETGKMRTTQNLMCSSSNRGENMADEMTKPPLACRVCGRGSCQEHKNVGTTIANSYAVKKQRPHFKQYHTKRWRDLADAMRRHNPICQHVDAATGVRCDQPSQMVHHIVDPKDDPSKFYDWRNLVALCNAHHSHSQGEDPNRIDRYFAPTLGAKLAGTEQPRQEHPRKSSVALSCDLKGLPDFSKRS
jgi:hypothetical protein